MRRTLVATCCAVIVTAALVINAPAGTGKGSAKPGSAAKRETPDNSGGKASAGRPLRIPHTRLRLDNGLEVVIHADRRVPRVVVDVLYRVGARNERPKRSGMAHLFEHLMFMGTKRIPEKQIDLLMEGGGGWNNAYTSEDVTNYYDVAPSRLLELLLWIEADRMATLAQGLTPKKLGLQQKVVLNERRQSYENAPYGKARLALPELLFAPSHPYGHTVIGHSADIKAVSAEDCKAFFGRYYAPGNAVLVIAGDVDVARARALAKRYFGWIPRGRAPAGWSKPSAQPAKLAKEVRRVMHDRVALPRLIMAWHSPPHFAAGDAELDLVASVLTSGKLSRLYRELVYKRRLAASVSAYQDSRVLGSVFKVTVTLRRGGDIKRVEALVRREIARFIQKPPSADELARAKARYQTAFVRSLQSLRSRAESLALYMAGAGRPDFVAKDLARYTSATPQTVHKHARAVLGSLGRVVIHVLPQPKSKPKPAPEPKAKAKQPQTKEPAKSGKGGAR